MQADAYAGFNRLYEAGRKPGPGAQGKDEIVIAGAYSTIMIAIITVSLVFWAIRSGWVLMRRVLIRLGH
jgi:hypothetical protein